MRGLLEAGKLRPVIDRAYPLEKVPEAIDYLESRRARGKVIITIAHDDDRSARETPAAQAAPAPEPLLRAARRRRAATPASRRRERRGRSSRRLGFSWA